MVLAASMATDGLLNHRTRTGLAPFHRCLRNRNCAWSGHKCQLHTPIWQRPTAADSQLDPLPPIPAGRHTAVNLVTPLQSYVGFQFILNYRITSSHQQAFKNESFVAEVTFQARSSIQICQCNTSLIIIIIQGTCTRIITDIKAISGLPAASSI